MPFTYRDKPKLADRFRGKSAEELLNELASDLGPDRGMFFDSPPWRQRPNNPPRFSRGFPFADDRKRRDIRAYLDDIATRHPEFADQLKEPPWDEEFSGTFLNRPGKSINPESEGNESGSSSQPPSTNNPEVNEPRQNLTNYGLRNTVPLGPRTVTEEDRHQRSMSAPPDNRHSDRPQKFVSKCEIPIMHDTAQGSGVPKPDQAVKGNQENAQQKVNNAPNVRVIPIQVEGRDAPLLNTNFDTSTNYGGDHFRDPAFEGRLPRDFGIYQRHSPRFGRKERSATPPHQQYASHFQEYVPSQHFGPSHQGAPQQQQHFMPPQPRHAFQEQQPPHQRQQQFQQARSYSPQPQHYQQYPPHPHHPQQSQQPQQQQQQPPPQQQLPQTIPVQVDETDSKAQAPPKPEPPKDPIEKVHMIQKEVEELLKQVESFKGNSRSDKQYLMLDELLTRQLLLLDNIDTEGKENVRQARKDTIRSIQRCISTLENKVPLAENAAQKEGQNTEIVAGEGGAGGQGDGASVVQAMEVDQTKENTPTADNRERQKMEIDGERAEKAVKEPSEKPAEGGGDTTTTTTTAEKGQ